MPIDSYGFTGTINEEEWARLAPLLGTDYSVADSAAQLVSAVSGSRSIAVAAGDSIGHGVVAHVRAGGEVHALTPPAAGQWFLVVMRRNWSTHASTVVVIPGATTSTAIPTAIPTVFPGAFQSDPGVLDDQPLAWAWANNVNTVVTVWDMRKRRIDERTTVLTFSDLDGVPTSFPPSSHGLDSHSGTLSIGKGGTGSTTAAAAREALGITPVNIGAAPGTHGHTPAQVGILIQTGTPTYVAGGVWLKPV